jgi:hypothetical protein
VTTAVAPCEDSAMAGGDAAVLRYAQLESSVSTSFWTELAQAKLERLRLSEEAQNLVGAPQAHTRARLCASRPDDATPLAARLLVARRARGAVVAAATRGSQPSRSARGGMLRAPCSAC